MKKVFICSLLLAISILAWSNSNDLIVLLDTSESMIGEFNSTVSYLIRDIIKNNVSINYTFHLLLFDSYTTRDMVKKIEKPEDGSAIINHLALIQPFGKYTDLIEALSTLLEYGKSLPSDHEINVVILTDGKHDPPPGKYSISDEEQMEMRQRLTDELKETGWNINIVPLKGDEPQQSMSLDQADDYLSSEDGTASVDKNGDGQPDKTDAEKLSDQLDADIVNPDSIEGQMVLTGGIHLVAKKTSFKSKNQKLKLKFSAENFNSKELDVTVLDVLYQGRNILKQPVTFSTESKGSSSFSLDLDFAGALVSSGSEYPVKLSVMSSSPVAPLVYNLDIRYRAFSFALDVLPILIIALVVIALIIIFTGISRTRSRIKTGVKDEKDNDYSVLGLKKNKNGKQATSQDRTYPYSDSERTKVKGTVYYPDSDKKGTSAGNAEQTVMKLKSRQDNFEQTKIAGSSERISGPSAKSGKDQSDSSVSSSSKTEKPSDKKSPGKGKVPLMSGTAEEAYEAIVNHPNFRARSHTKNIKYLLMLNVNTPFNPLMAGTRVQRLDKDKELTIGSGNSSFYLYFSKMLPGAIASIKFNGNRCSFIPHDFKYFPGLKAPLDDCVNQKIRVVHGKEEQIITFKEWLSPLEEINRIMHLIDYRGMPKSPLEDE